LFHESAIYIPMYLGPDLQAYRTDTFEGWIKQPADIGPVIFNNSSPTYVALTPVGASDDGGSGVNWLLWGGIAAVVVILAGVLLARRNRSTADERE
jgi:LPXTG-motif cell wall-anchored protein